MRWLVAIAAIAGAAGPAAAEGPKPVEVMVLGTYHFDNPGRDLNNPRADDVLKPQRQRELEALAAAVAEFRPTKIMVERVVKAPDLVDLRYADFKPEDLAANRDERAQIAYRLARRLGHATVYGIDEQPAAGEPDYFPFGKVTEWAKANGAGARLDALMAKGAAESSRIEQLQKTHSIAGALAELNRPAKLAADQQIYYELLKFGGTDQQPGAELNAMWYLRNAKIFGKLMTVAQPGDRLLVVYGVGHAYWLQHFANATPGYRNVDPTPYLEKAAAALR